MLTDHRTGGSATLPPETVPRPAPIAEALDRLATVASRVDAHHASHTVLEQAVEQAEQADARALAEALADGKAAPTKTKAAAARQAIADYRASSNVYHEALVGARNDAETVVQEHLAQWTQQVDQELAAAVASYQRCTAEVQAAHERMAALRGTARFLAGGIYAPVAFVAELTDRSQPLPAEQVLGALEQLHTRRKTRSELQQEERARVDAENFERNKAALEYRRRNSGHALGDVTVPLNRSPGANAA